MNFAESSHETVKLPNLIWSSGSKRAPYSKNWVSYLDKSRGEENLEILKWPLNLTAIWQCQSGPGDQIRIEQEKNLFVKDMIVQSDPIMVGRNKIVPIECVMFVQPSISDYRLSLEQQQEYPITSCCIRTIAEVSAFVRSTDFTAD